MANKKKIKKTIHIDNAAKTMDKIPVFKLAGSTSKFG
jgi:hypothetical protein